MGLEVATYIGGLTPSWPLAGDLKSQGDDHLRLLKSVLQSTFPTATRPFYFPTLETTAVTINLDATDQNNIITLNTSGGNVVVNLPSTLTTADKGWSCEILKATNDTNAGIVTPASGNIDSKCGSTATIRVGIVLEPARFIWHGAGWYCSKPGPMIGSTENFDGATVPPGYLLDDGSAFSNTAFAELFAVLGSSTLRDKRGRVEAGVDGGVGRLTSTYFGSTATLGAANGLESNTLTVAQLAVHSHANTLNDFGHTHGIRTNAAGGSGRVATSGAGDIGVDSSDVQTAFTGMTITNSNSGSGNPHPNVQPTIIVNKIKRAC